MNDNNMDKNYIVGIGASAGGLEAIQNFLAALPTNTGFPFILIQHLSPDYKSLLCEILSRHTTMPVVQVEDGMEVKPNHVYVIQPGKNMQISKGKLYLSAQKERELNLPIDLFFRSLAHEAGSKAIAIIMSGTGSDGSNGIREIKENEGMALVQDLDTAKFDGMPKSAMRTGIVDAQMSPEMMASEISHIAFARLNNSMPIHISEGNELDEELIKKVYVILKKVCNVNFSHYKRATIIRRMERRMMLTHKETLQDYVDYLYEEPGEAKILSKEILIGVTSFFRDPDFFQVLKDKAIQHIIINGEPTDPIRVWIAGCSTGEEAYSIAILFCECMEALKVNRPLKIFATDLDAESIDIAGKGVYSDSIIDAVSVPRLSKYFTLSNKTYTVKRELRKKIIFSTHNVFQDPPFGKLDLISCRNMMIYFQPVLQNDMFNIFHMALKNKGYLFLGKSEAVGTFTEAFPVVDAVAKIFTHNSGVKYASVKKIPFLKSSYLEDELGGDFIVRYNPLSRENEDNSNEDELIDTSVLEQFMPASLIIDGKNRIIHTYGECSNYVHVASGKFTNALFDILTENLKVPVMTILKESRDKKEKIQYKDICFKGENNIETICMTAAPVKSNANAREELIAILFLSKDQQSVDENAVPYEVDRIASQRISDLEQFLRETQEKLEKSAAEQDCVNEELQSTNEELLTANEELQSSNEELQSVNEELYTVNAEYQEKLTELSNLNDDIANFLASTLIGIIFIDKDLHIKRFTNYVSTEFSVLEHDIGRTIKSISYHFPEVDFEKICTKVFDDLVQVDREVTSKDGKDYLMRVSPYRSVENTVLGCVITLVDLTTQKEGIRELRAAEDKLVYERKANADKRNRVSSITDEFTASLDQIVNNSRAMENEESKENRKALQNDISQNVNLIRTLMKTLTATLAEKE